MRRATLVAGCAIGAALLGVGALDFRRWLARVGDRIIGTDDDIATYFATSGEHYAAQDAAGQFL